MRIGEAIQEMREGAKCRHDALPPKAHVELRWDGELGSYHAIFVDTVLGEESPMPWEDHDVLADSWAIVK